MFDVVITGSVVCTGEEVIVDGYVYIKDGRVRDVGEQPVPEDYTYATLVLGGPHRIVTPGLAAASDVVAYPLRHRGSSPGERLSLYDRIPADAQAVIAIPGVYELHMRGFTSILVEATQPRVAVDLKSMAGGIYGLAVPACRYMEKSPLPTIRVSLPGCEGEGATDYSEVLYIAGEPLPRILAGIDADQLWNLNYRLRRAAGLPPGTLKPGSLAEVAVFDSRRPPLTFLEYYPEKACLAPLVGGFVESLLVGDEVLVDGGQHLNIVDKHLSRAIEEGVKYIEGSP